MTDITYITAFAFLKLWAAPLLVVAPLVLFRYIILSND